MALQSNAVLTAVACRDSALWALLESVPSDVRAAAAAVAVDATSPTALLVDGRDGAQLAPPSFYTETAPAEVVEAVKVRRLV